MTNTTQAARTPNNQPLGPWLSTRAARTGGHTGLTFSLIGSIFISTVALVVILAVTVQHPELSTDTISSRIVIPGYVAAGLVTMTILWFLKIHRAMLVLSIIAVSIVTLVVTVTWLGW